MYRSPTWTLSNYARITSLTDEFTSSSNASAAPLALFDFDNTLVRGDIGDAMLSHMLKNDLLIPQSWSAVSAYLTENALLALASCSVSEGRWITSNTECGNEIWSIYSAQRTVKGRKAWNEWPRKQFEPAYAWLASLLAGYSPEQIESISASAREIALNSPSSSPTDLEMAVRYIPPMSDLIALLQSRGFEVWVISASPQFVLYPWTEPLGIPQDRVIGIRNLLSNGVLSPELEQCDPSSIEDLITYADGKLCWARKLIRDPVDPVLVAGDSMGDLPMLLSATRMRILVDRGIPELLELAENNDDGKWIIERFNSSLADREREEL